MKFVGREAELQNLHEMLQENNQVVIAAVAGMGGLGKTELALQYANAHREIYKGGICWLQSRTGDVGIQVVQFARIHLDLNPPQYLDGDLPSQVKYCWQHWREGDVLVVLDDLNDYSKVETYLPPQLPRFKVLITTRLQLDLPQSFTLNVLGESAGVELLQLWVREKVTEESATAAKKLCERLGYLPLALNLVGRYIKKRRISLAEMVQRLDAKGKALSHQALALDEKDRTCTLNVKRGVIAAFELSWEELSNDAKELGVLLSLFALAPIPWRLVESVETGKDAEQLEDSRVELESLHLLQGEDSYQLHQLIREFFQLKQAEFNQVEEFKRSLCKVMLAVAKEIPEYSTLKQITDVSNAIPHVAEVANNLATYLSNEDIARPFTSLGEFYEYQGLYKQAELWYEQCRIITQNRFGLEHLSVAQSLNNLALIYKFQGYYIKAEPFCLQALKLTQCLLGHEDLLVATSLNNLAELYKLQGRYTEAQPLFLQALEMRQRLLRQKHSLVATSLNNLAELYKLQGRYTEAEPLYNEALEMYQSLLGQENPLIATSLNNLATLYFCQKCYMEAEPLFLQALELRQRLLGQEHPDVVQSLNNLSELYKYQGRYTEAETLLQQALEIGKRLLGQEHPNFAISLSNLAFLYMLQGRYKEAELLLEQALKICEQSLGAGHPSTVVIRSNYNYAISLRQA
ncbi:tetratricopeptide repeat protein [Nostoc sp.]|uniref:tetratricopeptide repeat protein n=1 Tax=Nostoc sp. TaxID=1180 RepID=UPI002FF74904